ncbi:MAG: DUF5916 domain-containing protein [Gemmatimonadota bacterium]
MSTRVRGCAAVPRRKATAAVVMLLFAAALPAGAAHRSSAVARAAGAPLSLARQADWTGPAGAPTAPRARLATPGARPPGADAAGDTLRSRPESLPSAATPKRLEALRLEGEAPEIDGRLEDPAWRDARWASDFVQKEPDRGSPPTQRTEVAFLYDEEALYVAARMHADDPDAIPDVMLRRDDDGNAERILVSLDTYHDRRTAYSFGVTASGVRTDWFHPEDSESGTDATFNPVWVGRAGRVPQGWTAEMRIPFSQLRFSGAERQVWGLNVQRVMPARNETVFWSFVPRDQSAWSSRFGELVGIERVGAARRIELVPYVSGDARLTSGDLVDPGNPLDDGRDMGAHSGLDLKMGLGSSLTLDATFNPDFGQVEADPAQVNLSAFEIFFDERRPFFTEGGRLLGAQLYAGGQSNDPPPYFYTRRIGGRPHGIPQGDFVDAPPTSTILGAAKLTGRMDSGLSVGGFAALTDDEHARTFDLASRETRNVRIEPLTTFGVTRLQQEIGAAGSTVAVMLTGVRRDLSREDPLVALLAREAFAGGVDWNLRFRGGEYDVKGHVGFSHVAGDSAAIGRTQRSPVHYYQRPDQGHARLDPGRTSLSGGTAALRFRKVSGGHWRAEAGVWGDSPGLELNDAGRLGRADDIALWGNLRYREDEPGPLLRNYSIGLFGNSSLNFGGVRRFSRVGLHSTVTWNNFWTSVLDVGRVPEWTSDDHTRGGPLTGLWSAWDLYAELNGNPQAPTRWESWLFYAANSFDASRLELGGEISTQPGDRWRVSIAPSYSHGTAPRQYLATLDGGPAQTFGKRYVFGYNEQSQLAAQVRANYAFTPDLGLEVYAEPFASSGRFYGFGELPEPGSRELRTFGDDAGTLARDEEGNVLVTLENEAFQLPNPDFDVLSFRSNLLLRWEWHPGSTLFLVWQQNRAESDTAGSLVGPRDLLESLGASGDNILALKLTYWIPIS